VSASAEEWKVDRTGWAPGPWDGEPDKEVWIDSATDLDCMAVRNHWGAWCGYVGVPPGHPSHGKGHDEVDVEVHGGLTYANECAGHVCHIPAPGRPDDVWWLGFDCAHYMDRQPGMDAFNEDFFKRHPDLERSAIPRETYKPIAYVKDECARLAAQLKEMS
jgi:hypothetical protein